MEVILNDQRAQVGYICEIERGYRAIRTNGEVSVCFPFRSQAIEWLGGVE